MSAIGGPNIVTDGLIFYIDASNRKSYQSGSFVWYDMVNNNEIIGLNSGSMGFDPSFGGYITHNNNYNSSSRDTVINPSLVNMQDITIDVIIRTTHSAFTHYLQVSGDGGSSLERKIAFRGSNAGSDRTQIYATFYNTASISGSQNISSTSGVQHSTSSWTYITATYNSTGSYVTYRNAVVENSGVPLNFSSWLLSYSGIFINYNNIAHMKIYNRQLSQVEVRQNYEALKSRYGLT